MLSSKDGKNKSTHLMIIMFIINFLKNLTCYLFSFISVHFIIFVLDWPIFVRALFGKLNPVIACINPFLKPQDELFDFSNNIKT